MAQIHRKGTTAISSKMEQTEYLQAWKALLLLFFSREISVLIKVTNKLFTIELGEGVGGKE